MDSRRTNFDRDLDWRPLVPPRQGLPPIEMCQRLVANPLLGVLCWIMAFALLRESVLRHQLALFAFAFLFVLVGVIFQQYHCLDCGKTGSLFRAHAHFCPAVVDRHRIGYRRRTRLPGIPFQLAAWLVILSAALILGTVALQARQ